MPGNNLLSAVAALLALSQSNCNVSYPCPLQRGGGIDQPIMRTVAAEIARGHWVHVFPEGKVTYTGTLGPLRWGIGKLVCDARRRANGRCAEGWL